MEIITEVHMTLGMGMYLCRLHTIAYYRQFYSYHGSRSLIVEDIITFSSLFSLPCATTSLYGLYLSVSTLTHARLRYRFFS